VTGQSAGNGGIETIVVTAQRRAEDIRDVPISITAVSAQALEDRDIRSFHDIQNIAPNFRSLQLGDSRTSVMRLRGVTSQQTNAGQKSSVANYIDGVFMSRTGMGTTQDLFDIERVEVLRGPQGDFFGMNTAAGIVNVITRNPNLSNFEGLAELEAGTWGGTSMRVRVCQGRSSKTPLGKEHQSQPWWRRECRTGLGFYAFFGDVSHRRPLLGCDAGQRHRLAAVPRARQFLCRAKAQTGQ
jgi:outer membrane receptor protein involved in Fe transport